VGVEAAAEAGAAELRHDWTHPEVAALFALTFSELVFRAQAIHRKRADAGRVQLSTLLSVKTGGCPEDCAYCPQSAHHATSVASEPLMDPAAVVAQARRAKEAGATRYCMGAAWRSPKDRDLERVCEMVRGVAALGMETCATLGMLTGEQARRLAEAGLDFYNHNLDTSSAYYGEIIHTRAQSERFETLAHVRDAGLRVCCGGIVGMGERREDRVELLRLLANLPVHPESVPINLLVQVPGTPLAGSAPLEPLEVVRTIAVARILMPDSVVRLSAGREAMSDETQALCFLAGAGSIFVGPKLLTTKNPGRDRDEALLARLGLEPLAAEA
jgi:biotin synthase